MADQPQRAQPGDELMRQMQGSLQEQLSLAEDFQRRGQERFGEVASFAAGQGVQNVESMRDLGQRVPGEAPSALIQASTGLGRALQTGVAEAQESASSKNILSILSSLLDLQDSKEAKEQQKIDNAIKEREIRIKENESKAELAAIGKTLDVDGNLIDIDPEGEFFQAKIDQMNSTERKPLSERASATLEMQRILKLLKNETGEITGEGFLKGITGPIATTIGDLFGKKESKTVRTELDVFQDKIRKDTFGTAFTDAEKKVAQLPGSGKQEAKNIRILNSMVATKIAEMTQALKDNGLTNSEIDAYFADRGISIGKNEVTKTDSSFDEQGAKDAGYSQEEIDKFKKDKGL